MKYEESRYFRDWFKIGDNELRRAQNLLDLKDLGGAGFNIQQAIEKYLKGYMLSQGWELRRIHNLDTLLNEAIIYEPSLEGFRLPCQRITEYYVEERYPLVVSSELTEEEMKESLSIAEKMIEKLRNLAEG